MAEKLVLHRHWVQVPPRAAGTGVSWLQAVQGKHQEDLENMDCEERFRKLAGNSEKIEVDTGRGF